MLFENAFAERNQRTRLGADGLDAVHARFDDVLMGLNDQITDEVIHHAANRLVELTSRRGLRIEGGDGRGDSVEDTYVSKIIDVDEAGTHAIIHVVIVVRDCVSEIRKLCFESRLRAIEKPFTHVPELARVLDRAVFQDAFTTFEREIQS